MANPIQTTSPFCCAYTPALKGWCVTWAMATQTTTYARRSPGLSVICERCSHRSLPSCSVAGLWWSGEATAGRSSAMRKLRSRKLEGTCHGMVWRGEWEPPHRNTRSGSCKPIVWLWRRSPTCMRRAIYEANSSRCHEVPCNSSSVRLGIG